MPIVPQTKSLDLRGFWETARELKLFAGVNVALILCCIAIFFDLPVSGVALLYLTAGILSAWAGVLNPVEGLACYFSLSFYTALPVVITGSPFLSSFKDILLIIATGTYILTAKYRRKSQHLNSNISVYKPYFKKRFNHLSISLSLLALFIVLAIVVLYILLFRYQNITLFLLGFRAYFFYLLVAIIAYKKLSIYLIPLLMRAILIAALWPSLVGILQVVQIVWSPAWLPSLVLFSEDNADKMFQGKSGVGIIQETLELVRSPATLTGVPQFACLNIITGIALITLISIALASSIHNINVSSRQWIVLLLLSVFFFVSILAGGNRMPIAILLVIGILLFFTATTLAKQKPKVFSRSFSRKKRRPKRVMIVIGFTSVVILVVVAVSIYTISLLPDIYMRYIGSIGYQINVRIEVLTTQIEPVFQFPLIDQFFGVGPATQSSGARYTDRLNISHIGGDLHAESQLLQQAVELGIIFFPIYFLPRVILMIWCLRKLALEKSQTYRGYLLPLAISFGVLTVVPYGNFITLDPMNAFYWLIGGLLLKFLLTKNQVLQPKAF